MTDQPPSRDSNPFATCWTRPGALPWIDTPCLETQPPPIDEVVARLEASGWRGQIVGPHGSGKSSLLRALEAPARVSGREPAFFAADQTPVLERGVVLFIEGFESLVAIEQHALLRRLHAAGTAFVVTTHAPLAELPVVATLGPSESLLAALFHELTYTHPTSVALDDALASWRRRRGNLRDVWFDLYNLHEKLTRPARTSDRVRAYSRPSGRHQGW